MTLTVPKYQGAVDTLIGAKMRHLVAYKAPSKIGGRPVFVADMY